MGFQPFFGIVKPMKLIFYWKISRQYKQNRLMTNIHLLKSRLKSTRTQQDNALIVDESQIIEMVDPLQNPQVAPQTVSGIKGGMYGITRNSNTKWHYGLDLKNDYGAPIYATHDGTARKETQTKDGKVVGAGYYVEITSTIDGKTVKILYFHLQSQGRVSGSVKAGDIIGYQGDSGNLKRAIEKNYSISHLHIKVKENGAVVDPINYLKTPINSDTGVTGESPCDNPNPSEAS